MHIILGIIILIIFIFQVTFKFADENDMIGCYFFLLVILVCAILSFFGIDI
jgi:hypothetical protein